MKSDTIENQTNRLHDNGNIIALPRKGMADRETRRHLVIEAAKQYPSGGGGVAWAEALREHPEWVEPLGATTAGGIGRLRAFTNSVIKRAGVVAVAPEVTPPPAPVTGSQGEVSRPGRASREERAELVLRAREEFPGRGNGVSWSEAFAAHPEWREPLGTPEGDEAAIARLYPFTISVLKTHKKARRKYTRREESESSPHERQAAPEMAVQGMPGVNYCLGCGKNLMLHNQIEAQTQKAAEQEMEKLIARIRKELHVS